MSSRPVCAHCWVWGNANLNFRSEDGTVFHGRYVTMFCGHCRRMGKIICRWIEKDHTRMIKESYMAFERVHRTKPCPSRLSKRQLKEFEYEF